MVEGLSRDLVDVGVASRPRQRVPEVVHRSRVGRVRGVRLVPPSRTRPGVSDPVASRVPGMTKWEYLTAPILTHAAKQILDNFGADGWELVQVAPGMNPENLVGYFKRPLAS